MITPLHERVPFSHTKSRSQNERMSKMQIESVWAAKRCWLLAALVLHLGLTCFAQTNVVSSFPPALTSRPLTGYQAATASYTLILQIGSGPGSFRVMKGSYWTDSAGRSIPFAEVQPRGPGDKHHRFTRVILGRASFSLPIPPLAAGFVGIIILLLLGILPFVHGARRRASDEPHQPQNLCTTKSN
jgi:hypothetical protein